MWQIKKSFKRFSSYFVNCNLKYIYDIFRRKYFTRRFKISRKPEAFYVKTRSWKARFSSATRDKPVSSSTEKEAREEKRERDRGKARRNHEISLDLVDV